MSLTTSLGVREAGRGSWKCLRISGVRTRKPLRQRAGGSCKIIKIGTRHRACQKLSHQESFERAQLRRDDAPGSKAAQAVRRPRLIYARNIRLVIRAWPGARRVNARSHKW